MKAAILVFFLSLPALADLVAGQKVLLIRDYATALKEFLPLAKDGNASAQYNLGLMYNDGHGVAQDYKEVLRWYALAEAAQEAN
jgi:uncharacterized protein